MNDETTEGLEKRFEDALVQMEKGLARLRIFGKEMFSYDEWDEKDCDTMKAEAERVRDNADIIYWMFR